ncbi:Ig kappa chain V-V region T1 [Labeo rohita]|uniref:Ig kappa chain V-V region T1 n=2 Tax=Labeo rohita TaxID=84645 RepID=A0ABQ8L470_LABRO|nr:Ig kappa chain V-V region T1 [Labeo rohita]
MKIIQFHIYLLMWFQATESLTNIAVTLGADVNITCDLDIKEVYWYKHKSPDPPVLILRTFDRISEGAKYENSISKHKYSVKTNSRLFIRNISTDELGVYYCVKTSEPLKFSNGTKIYISESVQRNQTAEFKPHDASQYNKSWRNLMIIIISSALLNVLLTITLIGLVIRYLHATRKCKNISNNPQTTTAAQHSEDTQYAEIDYPICPRESRPCQDQTTILFYSQ